MADNILTLNIVLGGTSNLGPPRGFNLGPPRGFIHKKGKRGFWFSRFFELHVRSCSGSSGTPGAYEIFLKYGKSPEELHDKYVLNFQDLNISIVDGDELHLENVLKMSATEHHNDNHVVNLKLKFGCEFYKTLWEHCIREAIIVYGYRDKAPGTELNPPISGASSVAKVSSDAQRLPVSPTSVAKGSSNSQHPPVSRELLFKTTHPDNTPLGLSSDFVEFVELLDYTKSRSPNSRILCQRLALFGSKVARYSHKYESSHISDFIVTKKENWQSGGSNQHRPLFLGLHDMVDNLFRQPAMFGLTMGMLGHLSAVTSAIFRYCKDGKTKDGKPRALECPSEKQEEWIEAQDFLVSKMDSLLQEAVQKSKTIAKHGSISLLLLELTNARMSLVAIPSGKKLELGKGIFQLVFGIAKSIAGMRLDPNVLSGLGKIATSSLGLLREGWAKDFCSRISSISDLPDFLNHRLSSLKGPNSTASPDVFLKFLKDLRSEIADRFHQNLFIKSRNIFTKDFVIPQNAILEIGRWEFHAAFAVMLTQVVLQLKHENLKLIKDLRSRETIEQHLSSRKNVEPSVREKYLNPVDGDRFVLELLLEMLDSYTFVGAKQLHQNLKETNSPLADIVKELQDEELVWLCEFHHKQWQTVAAARQIDKKDSRYIVSRTDQVGQGASDEELDSSFMSKFKGYDVNRTRVIAHSNALISDLIYGFSSNTKRSSNPENVEGTTATSQPECADARVRGLVDLACYGLDASDSELDSNPSYKLSQWASKFVTVSTSDTDLMKNGFVQLQDFILDMVVGSVAKFEMGQIAKPKSKSGSDSIDPQIATADFDRRLKSLERAKEQLGKARKYVLRFGGLVKVVMDHIKPSPLPSENTPSDHNKPSPPPGNSATSDEDKPITPGELFELDIWPIAAEKKLKLGQNISREGNVLAQADETIDQALIDLLRNSEIEVLKCVCDNGSPADSKDLHLKYFGFFIDSIEPSVTSDIDVTTLCKPGDELTWEKFRGLQDYGSKNTCNFKAKLIRTSDVQVAQVFRQFSLKTTTNASTKETCDVTKLLMEFLQECIPNILQLLSERISHQVDYLCQIKQLSIEERITKFNDVATQSMAHYSAIATEFKNFLSVMFKCVFAKLVYDPSSKIPEELASVVDSIKDSALTELRKLADNELVATGKEVVGQIEEVLSNIGIKSIFNSLGSLLSDYNKGKEAEQEPFRVREVAVFCIAFLAAATGSVELQLFLGAQRIKELHPCVKAVLNATDTSVSSYNPAIFEHLLKFWCPTDVANDCRHMFCLSGGQNALQVSPQDIFFENDEAIQQYIAKKFEDAEKLRDELEKKADSNIVEKQLLMVKLRRTQKEIKQLASNVSDAGAKLNIVIDYLGDMQDQLGRMDAKLSSIQSGIDDLRKDMFALTGKPLMEIIEQCSKEQIAILNRQLAEEVYVPSKALNTKYCAPSSQDAGKWSSTKENEDVDTPTSLGRILAKDLMRPKWSKGTLITEKMLKDMKDAGIERVRVEDANKSQEKGSAATGIDESQENGNVEIGIDESQSKVLAEDVKVPVGEGSKVLAAPKWSKGTHITEELLKDMKDAGIEKVKVETVEEIVETAFSKFMNPTNPSKSEAEHSNVFLLAGKAGSGKSTTLNRLKRYILTDYARLRKQMGWTVVLLSASLPSLKNPKTDLFREAAMQTFRGEFRELHVDLLREKCRLKVDEYGKVVEGNDGVEIVFFLDAWDELRPENQDNLWVTNNLERYRPVSEDSKACMRFPKVFFTCRQETIEQFESKAEKANRDSSTLPISCVKYFFPREISNHDRDEDHECVKYFQDWRIQDFPEAGREKYLNQHVAHHLRKEFFKQIKSDFVHVASNLLPENTDSENSKSHQLKTKLNSSHFMSKVDTPTSLGRILAKDLMRPKWSKGTLITEKMLKDMKDAGIERVRVEDANKSQEKGSAATGIDESQENGNVEIGIDESQSKVLAEDVEVLEKPFIAKGTKLGQSLIKELQTAGSHGVKEVFVKENDFADALIDVCSNFLGDSSLKIDDIVKTFLGLYSEDELMNDFDLIRFASAFLVACFCLKFNETQRKKYYDEFLLDQRKAFGMDHLWMPDKFNTEFNQMSELSELVKTPFMVQVFSRILPKLHQMKVSYGFADAKKHMQHIDSDFGPLWASYVISNLTDEDFSVFSKSDDRTAENLGRLICKKLFDSLVSSVRRGNMLTHIDHLKILEQLESKSDGEFVDEALVKLVQTTESKEKDTLMFGRFLKQLSKQGQSNMGAFECLKVNFIDGQIVVNDDDDTKTEIQERTLKIISLLKLVQGNKWSLLRILTWHDDSFQREFNNEYSRCVEEGDHPEILTNLCQKIACIMRSPPLLRGVIYKVFCQHIVQENVGRKRGDAPESEVLLEAIHYSRNLALHLSSNSLSKLTQTRRSKLFSDAHESDKFFREDDLLSAARGSAPVKVGYELSFMHKTLQEYFVAECIANQVLEAFEVEQITPAQFTEWLKTSEFDFSPPADVVSPKHQNLAFTVSSFSSSSASVNPERLKRVAFALAKGPLNHYEFTSDQEKVSVLDFFLDNMFMDGDFVEHMGAVVALCSKWKASMIKFLDLDVLSKNLISIVTQPCRLDGRCLMHEVLFQNNFQVFDFCIDVFTSLLDSNISSISVKDKFGRPPVYYALTRPGCLLLDKMAPRKALKKAPHKSQADSTTFTMASTEPVPKRLMNVISYCDLDDEKLKDLYQGGDFARKSYRDNMTERGFTHTNASEKQREQCAQKTSYVVAYPDDPEFANTGDYIRKMKLAGEGKSLSQGGFNMDKMTEFIELNRLAFDATKGPIRDAFPALHALRRRDLNILVNLILALDKSSDGSASKPSNSQLQASMTIHEAAKHGATDTVAELLKDPKLLNSRDVDNNTPLMKAAIWNKINVVKLLLERKADVNAQKDNGKTALIFSAEKGHKEVAKVLLENNFVTADVNMVDKNGRTASVIAGMNSHNDLQTYLEEVALRPRLRLAANGKSASQGGLNIPEIRSFISQKESLFTNGHITKTFEDFQQYIHSLSRSQLNGLLGEILAAEESVQSLKYVVSASPATSVAAPDVAPGSPKHVSGTAAASPATSVAAPDVAPGSPKHVSGTAAASPATPLTAQKAVPKRADDARPKLEALLKQKGIALENLQKAARGKSGGAGGLYVEDIKTILNHFDYDQSGLRAELESKLSLLLSSLGVQ